MLPFSVVVVVDRGRMPGSQGLLALCSLGSFPFCLPMGCLLVGAFCFLTESYVHKLYNIVLN